MKKIIILLFILALLSWCWKSSKKDVSVLYPDDKKVSYNGKYYREDHTLTGKDLNKTFDLNQYKKDLERKIFIWNEKILSWMNQILFQIKNNIQVFNQEWLDEFKKMLVLHEENLELMQKLVSLQKKRYDCFMKKYNYLNQTSINSIKKKIHIHMEKNIKKLWKDEKSVDKINRESIDNYQANEKAKNVKKEFNRKDNDVIKDTSKSNLDKNNNSDSIGTGNKQKTVDKWTVNTVSNKKWF